MPLVSLIIATYNRAHVIAETLDSIRNQTFENWECIIIDDGSSDNTEAIVQEYLEQDARFIFLERPSYVTKGANACRNYGFEVCKGSLVKFFDSDDIMLPDHLFISVNTITEHNLDFVVSDCQNFNEQGLQERPYETDKNYIIISAEDFAYFRNGWITNDLMVKRTIAEKLEFNEEIRDLASEYQYCIKLLLSTQNGLLIPDILTHRRVHDGSIFVQMTADDLTWKSLLGENKLFTASYIADVAPKELIRWLLSGFMQYSFDISLSRKKILHHKKAFRMIRKYYSLPKALAFSTAIGTAYVLKKGYAILTYART